MIKLWATLAAVLLVGSTEARAARPVQPQWTSDEVRAVRPIDPEPALVFQLRTQAVSGGKETTTTQTVSLADSFTLTVSPDGSSTLNDRSLRRQFSWSRTDPFLNLSAYAIAAFRVAELNNRNGLRTLLTRLSSASKPISPYFDEAELGVAAPGATRLIRRDAAGTTTYGLGDQTVATVVGDAGPLSPAERQRFIRYLALRQPVHAEVRRGFAERTALPARIDLVLGGARARTYTLTLSGVHRESLAYPLPPGLTPNLLATPANAGPAQAAGVRQALLALDGRAKPPKPTFDGLLTQTRKALEGGHPVDGFLLFTELSQQFGRAMLDPRNAAAVSFLRPGLERASQDPTVARLLEANRLAGDPQAQGDREGAAGFLARHPLDGAPFATFRYVTYANLLRNSPAHDTWSPRTTEGMPKRLTDAYWLHIAAYPWAGNAYKDLGDAFYEGFDEVDAWLAYDLGRAVDPDWRSGVLADVEAFEKRLATSLPDLF